MSADTLARMRTRSETARRAGRATATTTALAAGLTLVLAAPASANTPLRGWEDGSDMSLMNALVLFVGGPLAIIVVISLLVMAPSAVRRSSEQGSLSRWGEPQWFGGELGAGSAERPAIEAAAVAAGTDDLDKVAAGGGASVRW